MARPIKSNLSTEGLIRRAIKQSSESCGMSTWPIENKARNSVPDIGFVTHSKEGELGKFGYIELKVSRSTPRNGWISISSSKPGQLSFLKEFGSITGATFWVVEAPVDFEYHYFLFDHTCDLAMKKLTGGVNLNIDSKLMSSKTLTDVLRYIVSKLS